MVSRERLRRALNHQEPDRVPMMMSANTWVVKRLKKHFGVQTDRELLKIMQIDIFDTRGIDYQGAVGPQFVGPPDLNIPSDWCGNLFPMFDYHEVITETSFGKTYSMGSPPLAALTSLDELKAYRWPQVEWFDFSNLRKDLQVWANEFAIAFTGPSVFQHATLFRGLSTILIEMATEPEFISFLFDKISGFYFDYTRCVLEEVGDLIDILRLADDIGTEQGLMISPKMISHFIGKWVKQFADLAHQYDVKLLFHTDGNVRKVIPDLIAWGVDILDPVQPEVPEMAHDALKREFGNQLCFSGGVSTQEILPHQGREAVLNEVKRVITTLGVGGGYILSPGHPILQGDVPIENIIAMYEAGVTYGTY